MSEGTGLQGKKLTLTLSWKTLSVVLVIALIALTVYTKPWESESGSSPRTISIKGESTIKHAPDSFVFNPTFEADSQGAINEKTNQVVKDVKALGLGDAGIQTQVSSYEDYGNNGPTGTYNYTVYLTLSVEDKELAQKIQDYLATSGATGSISPTVSFTKDTQKKLRDEATVKAVEDAKQRGESTAKNLGVKVVKVIKVNEPDNTYDIYPIASYDATLSSEAGKSLPINAGESEFSYSVTVDFEIR